MDEFYEILNEVQTKHKKQSEHEIFI